MEVEEDSSLLFLDVLVTKKPNGTLGHTVYRKPTHMDQSHHHPSQKDADLKIVINWARTIFDTESLNAEIQH
jgi:hypothetical protein